MYIVKTKKKKKKKNSINFYHPSSTSFLLYQRMISSYFYSRMRKIFLSHAAQGIRAFSSAEKKRKTPLIDSISSIQH